MGIIYGLRLIEGDGAIRYVGKTIRSLSSRVGSHRYAAKTLQGRRPVADWINSHGLYSFEAIVLAETESPEGLSDLEIQHIRELGTHVTQGGLNVTRGGDGSLGLARTSDQREAQRLAMTGRVRSLQAIERTREAHLGSTRSEEARSKMREGAKRRVRSPEELQRISDLGRKVSREDEVEILRRLAAGEFQRVIAADFGITQAGVSKIKVRYQKRLTGQRAI